MMLAIDVGNSNIKIGLFGSGEWKRKWQVRTIRDMTADEYGLVFQSLLNQADLQLSEIASTVMSSVVPPVTGSLRKMLRMLAGAEPLTVAPGIKTGIRTIQRI